MAPTVEKKLRLYVRLTDLLVTTGMLILLFRYKLDLGSYFHSLEELQDPARWGRFWDEKGPPALLSVLVLYIFVVWRFFSRSELEIGTQLFSRSRTPQEWTRVHGHKLVPILIAAFYLLFSALALTVDNPAVFGLTMAALYGIALASQFIRKRNLERYFADHRFQPPDSDEHKAFILRRRQVAREYLFDGRHLVKEASVIAGSLAASAAAFIAAQLGLGPTLPFTILVATIVINEIVTFKWRRARNRELDKIEEEQIRADRDRVRE
jgi:hypothetical protein